MEMLTEAITDLLREQCHRQDVNRSDLRRDVLLHPAALKSSITSVIQNWRMRLEDKTNTAVVEKLSAIAPLYSQGYNSV